MYPRWTVCQRGGPRLGVGETPALSAPRDLESGGEDASPAATWSKIAQRRRSGFRRGCAMLGTLDSQRTKIIVPSKSKSFSETERAKRIPDMAKGQSRTAAVLKKYEDDLLSE